MSTSLLLYTGPWKLQLLFTNVRLGLKWLVETNIGWCRFPDLNLKWKNFFKIWPYKSFWWSKPLSKWWGNFFQFFVEKKHFLNFCAPNIKLGAVTLYQMPHYQMPLFTVSIYELALCVKCHSLKCYSAARMILWDKMSFSIFQSFNIVILKCHST